MDERPVTPLTYLTEIPATSWRNGGERGVALGCVVVGVTAVATRSSMHLLSILLPAIGAALLFQGGVAAWRVYRRQRSVIATTRSLLDLNASERTDLEQHLLARYRNREKRLEERHAARLTRLTDDISALQAGLIGGSAGVPGGDLHVVSKGELSRADDDGWPVTALRAQG